MKTREDKTRQLIEHTETWLWCDKITNNNILCTELYTNTFGTSKQEGTLREPKRTGKRLGTSKILVEHLKVCFFIVKNFGRTQKRLRRNFYTYLHDSFL